MSRRNQGDGFNYFDIFICILKPLLSISDRISSVEKSVNDLDGFAVGVCRLKTRSGRRSACGDPAMRFVL